MFSEAFHPNQTAYPIVAADGEREALSAFRTTQYEPYVITVVHDTLSVLILVHRMGINTTYF